jgi:hypothetical protein
MLQRLTDHNTRRVTSQVSDRYSSSSLSRRRRTALGPLRLFARTLRLFTRTLRLLNRTLRHFTRVKHTVDLESQTASTASVVSTNVSSYIARLLGSR